MGIAGEQSPRQALHERQVTDEHDGPGGLVKLCGHRLHVVQRSQARDGDDPFRGGESLPQDLCRLPGARLAAVTDLLDLDAQSGGQVPRSFRVLTPQIGERSIWILLLRHGLSVLYKIDSHSHAPLHLVYSSGGNSGRSRGGVSVCPT